MPKIEERPDEPQKDENNLPAIYEAESGQITLRFDGTRETFWATQAEIAEILGCDRSVITKHINNIFASGELEELSNVQKMHIAQSTKPVITYMLDVILSVGYRVNSVAATKFRKWATQTLSEYIREGALVDDRRLAQNPALAKKLAAKLRNIRTSEVSIYAKVRDVFKESSSDYDGNSQTARSFYAMAQDKFHYAITQKTAAEIIMERAHAGKRNMGLVSMQGQLAPLMFASPCVCRLRPWPRSAISTPARSSSTASALAAGSHANSRTKQPRSWP